jgi:hypothetical protein
MARAAHGRTTGASVHRAGGMAHNVARGAPRGSYGGAVAAAEAPEPQHEPAPQDTGVLAAHTNVGTNALTREVPYEGAPGLASMVSALHENGDGAANGMQPTSTTTCEIYQHLQQR